MSIFSSLISWVSDDDEDEDEELYEGSKKKTQQESALTGELYEGMTLDVSTQEGAPLLSGKIKSLTSDTLVLERLPGGLAFPTCSLDAAVTATGLDRKMIPVRLRAAVQESTRTVFKLKNLQVETHVESRESFRLPINAPVSLYHKDDDKLKNPEECSLLDISAGGACVQSEYVHMEDEVLRIRIQLEEYSPLTFLGQIVRCEDAGQGKFRYGILFAQLTEAESTNLNRILFNLQMGVKRTHMRSEQGHW